MKHIQLNIGLLEFTGKKQSKYITQSLNFHDNYILKKMIIYYYFRVKKPSEFNRPKIPLSERKVTRPTSSYHSKKVCLIKYLNK